MTLLVQQFAPCATESAGELRLLNKRDRVTHGPVAHDYAFGERLVVPAHPRPTIAERHQVSDLIVATGVHDAGGYP